jgi:hypothetical protein
MAASVISPDIVTQTAQRCIEIARNVCDENGLSAEFSVGAEMVAVAIAEEFGLGSA